MPGAAPLRRAARGARAAARRSPSCTRARRSIRGSCASSRRSPPIRDGARSPACAPSSRSTPAPPSSLRARPTTTPPGSARRATARRARGPARRARRRVVILGSGPNRIGQGIEFDYCCVHAAMTVRESGRDAVMINCNPETVSTDYDTSDRLYFEPLTLEDVLAVLELEQPEGVIVQFGGQTPLRLAAGLERAGVPLLGTSVDAIDAAEDRGRFGELLDAARLPGAAVRDRALGRAGARRRATRSASRCSCGRATCSAAGRWRSSTRRDDLAELPRAQRAGADGREIFLDRFLENAIEVDVDALCDGSEVVDRRDHAARRGGGRSTPATRPACCRRTRSARRCSSGSASRRAASRSQLGVVGLINVQFAIVRRPARAVRDRGQPARLADRPVRLQGDRRPARQARLPDHARRADRRRSVSPPTR